jgi:hypothetical protein
MRLGDLLGARGRTSCCTTFGGLASAAGLVGSHPHLTPWPSARRRIVWTWRTLEEAIGKPCSVHLRSSAMVRIVFEIPVIHCIHTARQSLSSKQSVNLLHRLVLHSGPGVGIRGSLVAAAPILASSCPCLAVGRTRGVGVGARPSVRGLRTVAGTTFRPTELGSHRPGRAVRCPVRPGPVMLAGTRGRRGHGGGRRGWRPVRAG